MNINFDEYAGECSCGKKHDIITKAAVIEPDCLMDIEQYLEQYGISGKRMALYDEHTYAATADRHPKADQVIILNPEGLHADEKSTAEVLAEMEADVEIILAVGSGTICDIARFCAFEKGISFVACATGASVDGFCSNVAAMTWYGYKKTWPAVPPVLVIADINIIRQAPAELIKSGVGDIFAKYIALADWKISRELTGEYFCERIYNLMWKAVDTVAKGVETIISGNPEAFADVTYALVMSGIAMQMMGNSRPASGAEHHISHMTEMGATSLDVQFSALHGEKTGVGTLVASEEYKRLAALENISFKDYAPMAAEEIEKYYGAALKDAIVEENKEDCLENITKEMLKEKWPKICELVKEIPDRSEIYAKLELLDAKRTLCSIGLSEDKKEILLDYSPMVRNRLTLMRIRRMIEL